MIWLAYEDVSKSFQTGRLERELQMVQFSATRYSCISVLWVSLVSFAAITLCVASQRVFIVAAVVLLWLSPETFGYTLVFEMNSEGRGGRDGQPPPPHHLPSKKKF
jgi:hypothetical protein